MRKRLFFITITIVTTLASCASSGEKKTNVADNDTIINGKEVMTTSNEDEVVAAKNDTVDMAQVKAEAKAGKSQVKDINFHSKVLNANREYTIYLPPTYHSAKDRHYPILYLLHGMLDDNRCWTRRAHLQEVADELIAKGEMREMIIVTPCAGGVENKDWNGYFNMPGWQYETFFMKEFMPYIESQYRVIGDKAHRGVAGLSMGGGAATSYAQRYPDLFCGVYAMSALMDIVPLPGHKAGPKSMVGLFSKSVADLATPKFVRNANEQTRQQLRTIQWYVDCGDHDFLLQKNKDFVAEMKKANIPLTVKYRPGKHSWQYWHSGLYIMLPFITKCMKP